VNAPAALSANRILEKMISPFPLHLASHILAIFDCFLNGLLACGHLHANPHRRRSSREDAERPLRRFTSRIDL